VAAGSRRFDRNGALEAPVAHTLVTGVTVTGGGLLFTGDLDDNLVAVDTKTGRTLYSFNTGGSVGGGVISYEVKGTQYVASLSGAVSGFFGGSGSAAVVIFALP
jgi:alcohol dehydrogenase (cytochrome c)